MFANFVNRIGGAVLSVEGKRTCRTAVWAAIAGAALLGGCGQNPVSNLLWFEATAESNATVLSQGPGRTLTLRCVDIGNGQPCRWNVRVVLRSSEALRRWALSLLGESGAPLLEVTGFNYVLSGFTTPLGGEAFGDEPDLLTDVGASAGDPAGAPPSEYVLVQFTLEYANPANGPETRTILAAFGNGGWSGVDPDADLPPLVQVGGFLPAPAIGGAVLPAPVIIVDLAAGIAPGREVCGDGVDNDGDGNADCQDAHCRHHPLCRTNPTIQCPNDLVVECDGLGNDAQIDAWLNSVTATSTCSNLRIRNDYDGVKRDRCGAAGSTQVTFRATDDCGSTACTARVTIADARDPEITAPADFSFDCADGKSVLVDWLHNATADDDCGEVEVAVARGTTNFDCSGEFVWTAADECGNESADSARLTITGDTQAPELTLNGPGQLTLECGVDEYVEAGATVEDDCDATLTAATISGEPVDTHDPGMYVLTYRARDLCGRDAAAALRTVTVVDTRAPRAEFRTVRLWPPNHEYVTLRLSDCVRAVDDCEGELDVDALGEILSAYSDEPENATGDGNTTADVVLVNDHTFRLRAERRGNGNGRVYGVTFEISDSAGHRLEETCRIEVPHDLSGRAAVDDGPGSGYTVRP